MKCMKCNCQEGKFQLLKCDSCTNYICENCSELSATEIRCVVLKKRKLIFLCPNCEGGLSQIPLFLKKINEMQNQIVELNNKLEDIKNSRDDNNLNINIPDNDVRYNDQIQELYERQIRASNIIMLNINESKKDNQKDRSEEDNMHVKHIIANTGVSVEDFKIYRLGKYTEGKARPIKVILPNSNLAISILKNRNKIKNVLIFSDKTKLQQNYYKQVKERLNEINKNGGNKIIKYINNIPTIVDMRSSNKKNI